VIRVVVAALGCVAWCPAFAQDVPEHSADLRLEIVARGLSDPLYLTAPAGDARLFVVEQAGRIRIVKDGRLLPAPFLDLRDSVGAGGERGLLGMAFHPAYAKNGSFYVDYTDKRGDTRIERFTVSSDPDVADAASGKQLLFIEQPYANHNGGLVMFGPDGMLYVGMGDGGSGGDPHGNGQKRSTLLGKLLRIDVDGGDPYAIPADNPFLGAAGARPEIWATGMRNPWRFAFDRVTGLLYVADVGQNLWEELDIVPAARAGLNYGWNVMEGAHCYAGTGCDTTGLVVPALEYDHSYGCAIIGGFVYRGHASPALAGQYFFSDYCQAWLRSITYQNGRITARTLWTVPRIGQVLSFGEDAAGEVYLCDINGPIYKFVAGE